jgi:hypothetical protein
VPIISFYLEIVVGKYAATQPSIIYYWDVHRIIEWLWEKQLPPIEDPLGISATINPCETIVQRQDALIKLKTAVGRTTNAFEAEQNKRTENAINWYRQLYGDYFPAYGT